MNGNLSTPKAPHEQHSALLGRLGVVVWREQLTQNAVDGYHDRYQHGERTPEVLDGEDEFRFRRQQFLAARERERRTNRYNTRRRDVQPRLRALRGE